MGNHQSQRYKVHVASQANVNRAMQVARAAGIALIFVGVSACGSTKNAASGLEPEGGAAATAVGGAGTQLPQGGAASGGLTPDGGEESLPTPTEGLCATDAECDDGAYCNGPERCLPQKMGADIKVCMSPETGPCGQSACDEQANECDCKKPDRDGDNFLIPGCADPNELPDCDDNDDTRHPGLKEFCDLSDPMHDEDCNDLTYGTNVDADEDGYVDAECGNFGTYQIRGTSRRARLKMSGGADCDDTADTSHPGAPEICDLEDNNCDGTIDDVGGTPPGERKLYYRDLDGDRQGDLDESQESACNFPPPGYVDNAEDCDDNNPLRARLLPEICNGIDDNCDDLVDQPVPAGTLMLDEPYDGGLTKFECRGKKGWFVDACPRARLDCDLGYLNGCETIGTTLCNCHECGKVCHFACGADSCEEIRAVSTGLRHLCLLIQPVSNNGEGRVACLGDNILGQLGLSTTPDARLPNLIPDLLGVTDVSSGGYHSCALKGDGRAYCWGANDYGQLGLGSSVEAKSIPQQVSNFPDEMARQIAAGDEHTCAIYEGSDGVRTVQCWGRGDRGQLGNGYEETSGYLDLVVRSVGELVYPLLDSSQVVAGSDHSCALTQGKVECWGSNAAQQLGQDVTVLRSSTAMPVLGLEETIVDQIAAAAVNTCARAGTKVYCWGANAESQLAKIGGPSGKTLIPLPDDIVSIAMGPSFACALSQGGAVRCWGTNRHGERGTTLATPGIEPTLVPVGGATKIFAGNGHQVCALKSDSSAWCWGDNDSGQLGNGTQSQGPQPSATRIRPLGGISTCSQVNP